MGVSYLLRCVFCNDKLENLDYSDGMTQDDYDKAWEALAEKLDREFYLAWGVVSPERLVTWVSEHKEHGKIEFTAE